ncbi:sodium:calcium antiporter [Halarcobacter mediterraneus]|uniref:Sodium:calcium antiporter n=1 Tax=Halarcobacter mediterraneus TaxID=2023153 RepID=A0A4Q1AWN1_9BACT|nr:type IV secretory system conjugative DNA transfer family protein [Halarcobacter mediterraneus]RXK13238.1 sodium:calcium antiporter [Halarcobacter mediterraneus]
MLALNKGKVTFLLIVDLFCTYFISGVVIFLVNDMSLWDIAKYYNYTFTYKALIQNYPLAYSSFLYTFLFFTVLVSIIPFLPQGKSLHGSARFAKKWEIVKMKLFSQSGLIVGKFKGKLLRFDTQEFVALGAPTRSGKGVSIVIPNLLEWKESCVVLDIKQECFDYTAKYRKEVLQNDVYLFNPFSYKTNHYNPLSVINMEDIENRDKQLLDFANLLYPLQGSEQNQFFNSQSQNLFIGLCYLYKDLALTSKGKEFLEDYELNVEFTMYGILKLSEGFEIEQESESYIDDDTGEVEEEEAQTLKGLDDLYEYLIFLEILSEEAKERLGSYINIKSVNTKSSVESTFNTPLLIYRNEPIRTATSKSDFSLEDVRKKKMTIYLGITPDNLEISKPILNIFFSQFISLNTKELPVKNKELKYTCLALMDEFTSIGYMPILLKAVSYIAAYNIRLMTIFQSISQLEAPTPEGYGREGAKTLLNNHKLKIFFAPDDVDESEKLSKRLGDTTRVIKSKSYSSGRSVLEHGTRGENKSEARRALMLPQELREMGQENELITMANEKPIFCSKSFYFNDQYFMDKFKKVCLQLKQVKGLPNREQLENAVNSNELNIQIKNIKG